MAYQIYQPCETLPAPARCNDIPFEVLDNGRVITTTDSLAQARLSRLDPEEREARAIVGGPPSGSTEEEDASAETRRQLSQLWITGMIKKVFEPDRGTDGQGSYCCRSG